jgi:putative FmdB family regulatory protein
MPIYEYQAKSAEKSCEYCSEVFEQIQKMSDPPLGMCPKCGAQLVKLISAPSVGHSASGLDQRAKAAGFHKLQRLGKGEYEKKY